MRLVYLGSPEDSIYPLEYLIENRNSHTHEVVAVISTAPKLSQRRGKHEEEVPLAAYAKRKGLLTLQPLKASDPEFQETLRKLNPEVMITCAYGQILNQAFLDIPKRATINIHPSLLPKYRGATPVQTALLDGIKKTGVTLLFTIKELDAGNIILQEGSPIQANELAGPLMTRLFKQSAPLLLQALEKLQDPSFEGSPQDPSQVSFCKKIRKEDGQINWNLGSDTIVNLYRGMSPWPGVFTFLNGKRIILSNLERVPIEPAKQSEPGELTFHKDDRVLKVACKDGFLKIGTLKPEGSRSLNPSEFWNGLKNREHLKFTFEEIQK